MVHLVNCVRVIIFITVSELIFHISNYYAGSCTLRENLIIFTLSVIFSDEPHYLVIYCELLI